jgi:hypothetical protein
MKHLYECSKCGGPVKVTPQGEGIEPVKVFACGHDDATIWANRKVVLRGKGGVTPVHRVRMTIVQALCWLTGRSI